MRVLLVVLVLCFSSQEESYLGKVVAVIDGDTIGVMNQGKEIRIRLNGIDAPEKRQAYGEKAKSFTSEWLFNRTVKVVPKELDRYGRLVADIYIDAQNTSGEYGGWFNKMIVVSGFAWHYVKYSNSKELAEAQEYARNARIGLWKDPAPVAPWEFRSSKK